MILLTHRPNYRQRALGVVNIARQLSRPPLDFANFIIGDQPVGQYCRERCLIFRGFSPLAPTHPPAKPPTPGPCYPSLYVPPRRTDSHPETGLKICQKWTSECHSSRWLPLPSCHISLQVPVGAVAGHLQPSSVPRNPRRHL